MRTFNAGIGLALVVAPEAAAPLQAQLEAAGETVFRIGEIEPGESISYTGALA
ncbi:AIR synthase-related protein [Alkalilacustris brevis]|uniref:AIR synthase-related protein n=1 Tax=Alkalilacustris brevis TaxID=2026338 RepID=UPI002368ABF3|nr:AIR synthase-related protein [Alkalilacustris brevis]